jgi:general secretion pathway protein D
MKKFAWLTILAAVPLALAIAPPPSTAADPESAQPHSQMVRVPGGEQRVTLRLRQLDLGDALRLIASRAKLSLNVAPDVKGKVDFDFYNERLNRILEVILVSNNLHMRQVGNTYLISSTPQAWSGSVRVFQLNYASADNLSNVLAKALTSAGVANATQQITSDMRSNTIVASGTESFMAQVGSLIARLDRPHQTRVFRLNYVKAEDTATLLQNSVFAGASGTGVKFVPITRDNTLMVVASPEDVRLVGEVISKIDRRLRQVLIEAKLIELNGTANQLLGVNFDAQSGTLTGGWNANGGLTIDYNPIQEALSQLRTRVNALVRDNKARLLASPQLIAMDSKESKIEITDEIIEKVQTQTTINANQTFTTQNVTLGNAGITLAITPKINPDGYISMNVKPTISFIRDTVRDSRTTDILATLKSQRTLTTPEVRVRDGETLIIGGLNQERIQENVDKFPILGDIPVIGAAFRRTDHTKVTTELVVLITPRLIPEGAPISRPAISGK